MAYRKRRRYRNYHSDSRVHVYFSSIINDIKKYFFSLPSASLNLLLEDYRETYGDSAYRYAISTYPLWASNQCSLSDQTLLRLIETLPKFLDEYKRISLINNLFDYYFNTQRTKRGYVFLEVFYDDYRHKLLEVIEDIRLKYPIKQQSFEFPKEVLSLASWLVNDDMQVARKILSDFTEQKNRLLFSSAETDIIKFIRYCDDLKSRNLLTGTHTLETDFPTVCLRVVVKEKTLFNRFFGMFS